MALSQITIQQIRDAIAQAKPQLAEMESVVAFMKGAGENTMTAEQQLADVKRKIAAYEQQLNKSIAQG